LVTKAATYKARLHSVMYKATTYRVRRLRNVLGVVRAT